jgi:hypothetical protein
VVKKKRPGLSVGRLAVLVTEKNWRARVILPIIHKRITRQATRQAIIRGLKVIGYRGI